MCLVGWMAHVSRYFELKAAINLQKKGVRTRVSARRCSCTYYKYSTQGGPLGADLLPEEPITGWVPETTLPC